MEIKGFLTFFLEDGPKGPQRTEIAQEFCYKALAEGAVFFTKSVTNELHLQMQVSE